MGCGHSSNQPPPPPPEVCKLKSLGTNNHRQQSSSPNRRDKSTGRPLLIGSVGDRACADGPPQANGAQNHHISAHFIRRCSDTPRLSKILCVTLPSHSMTSCFSNHLELLHLTVDLVEL
ncbi:unnamed protein product [Toxocara canis]|uniref:Uncharacterized protein n=1 Tax=Toxocara canis TaxID=6265 RepID=A0A183UTI5_TOXCA|nr:unnamed protein product [Toxocara canis]